MAAVLRLLYQESDPDMLQGIRCGLRIQPDKDCIELDTLLS